MISNYVERLKRRSPWNSKLFSLEDFLWINIPNNIFDYLFFLFLVKPQMTNFDHLICAIVSRRFLNLQSLNHNLVLKSTVPRRFLNVFIYVNTLRDAASALFLYTHGNFIRKQVLFKLHVLLISIFLSWVEVSFTT